MPHAVTVFNTAHNSAGAFSGRPAIDGRHLYYYWIASQARNLSAVALAKVDDKELESKSSSRWIPGSSRQRRLVNKFADANWIPTLYHPKNVARFSGPDSRYDEYESCSVRLGVSPRVQFGI